MTIDPDKAKEEIVCSVGDAIAAWQFVEENLCYLFCTLLSNTIAVIVTYYSIINLYPRLNMIHQVIIHMLPDRN